MKTPPPCFRGAALFRGVRWSVWVALACGGLSASQAGMVNRWSFNNAAGSPATHGTTFADAISGAPATVVGVGATLSGTALTLPGSDASGQTSSNVAANTIAAYLDLPNGLISTKTNLTVEIWATTITAQKQQRLFDFGRNNLAGVGSGAAAGEITNNSTTAPGTTSASDDIDFIANSGTNLNTQQLEARLNAGTTIKSATALTTTAGTEYHYVFVFQDGVGSSGAAGGRFSWYRNGAFVTSIDLNFRLNSIEDVNNWLGRAQWTGDFNANIAFNEVRIYDHALSQSEISASMTAGPDTGAPAPVAVNDALTMHRGQKARIAVLANDTGNISSSTVAIVQTPQFGTAVPDGAGKILYTHTTGAPAGDTFTYRVSGGGGPSAPATVTITFSDSLRLATSTLNVPSSAPPVATQFVDAFAGLTFNSPICLTSPPNDTKRLFVVERGGTVRLIPDVTAAPPTSTQVLSLASIIAGRTPSESLSTSSELGLLSLAVHPQFATNGYVFVFYSVNFSNATYERVSRITLSNPTSAAPSAILNSELILFTQKDDQSNHNGGDLHFGADGYLYISVGDEGGQKDQQVINQPGNSQRIDKDFFSAILRIDVDKKSTSIEPAANPNPYYYPSSPPADAVKRTGGVANYAVPKDNPFVPTSLGGTWNGTGNYARSGEAGFDVTKVRSEIWALGLRNPWRFSFDPANGDLWCGDVGQDAYEEVNIITKGGNYGWVFREGLVNTNFAGTVYPTPVPPAGFSIDPIYNYTHGSGSLQGISVTGGVVYRGTRFAPLSGAYIFCDYVSGNVWALRRTPSVTIERITGENNVAAFGVDPSNGDVLAAGLTSGVIRRLVIDTPAGQYPQTLSATNLFADLTDLSPAPGVLPYSPNLTFWSDFAVKRRWFVIPSGTSKITWAKEGAWAYPDGMIWIKHFDLEATRTNPPTTGGTGPRKRLETRLLVKNSTGVYGVSYRWNDAGTEATLVDDAGVDFTVPVTQNGQAYTQSWHIPSRAECLACHNPPAGGALSFNTRQLNQLNTLNGFAGNQLDLLRNAGYFTAANPPASPNLLPRHFRADENVPLEARARSFLAVNCSYCHRPGGTAPTAWDARPEISLAQMGIVNAPANNNGGSISNRLIVPGDLLHSIIPNRVGAANGFARMPPLATAEIDQTDLTLLNNWITQALPNHQTYDQWRQTWFNSTTSPESAPTFDADEDARTNRDEFLGGTSPVNGGSFLLPQTTVNGGSITVTFDLPADRAYQVETTTDLATWSLWDVPGNNGLPVTAGPRSLTGPKTSSQQFFRLQLWEN